ncbi:MAG: hypothetical protein ACOCP4_02800 [Candidatus Woesearchaeota archaeon]
MLQENYIDLENHRVLNLVKIPTLETRESLSYTIEKNNNHGELEIVIKRYIPDNLVSSVRLIYSYINHKGNLNSVRTKDVKSEPFFQDSPQNIKDMLRKGNKYEIWKYFSDISFYYEINLKVKIINDYHKKITNKEKNIFKKLREKLPQKRK